MLFCDLSPNPTADLISVDPHTLFNQLPPSTCRQPYCIIKAHVSGASTLWSMPYAGKAINCCPTSADPHLKLKVGASQLQHNIMLHSVLPTEYR